jgi:hypothetical protein
MNAYFITDQITVLQQPRITRYIIVAAGPSRKGPIAKFLYKNDESYNLIALDIKEATDICHLYSKVIKFTVFKVIFQSKDDYMTLRGQNLGSDYYDFIAKMQSSDSIREAFNIEAEVFQISSDDLMNGA